MACSERVAHDVLAGRGGDQFGFTGQATDDGDPGEAARGVGEDTGDQGTGEERTGERAEEGHVFFLFLSRRKRQWSELKGVGETDWVNGKDEWE